MDIKRLHKVKMSSSYPLTFLIDSVDLILGSSMNLCCGVKGTKSLAKEGEPELRALDRYAVLNVSFRLRGQKGCNGQSCGHCIDPMQSQGTEKRSTVWMYHTGKQTRNAQA